MITMKSLRILIDYDDSKICIDQEWKFQIKTKNIMDYDDCIYKDNNEDVNI